MPGGGAERDLDAFESELAGALGASTAAEVTATYRWIAATRPASLFAADPAPASRLGVRPASARGWIAAR
ncbi:hypothetical protein [Nonomuraea sp. LPB2021202275-12-8]|uniref:hypothetical protein n=1 Tax=Nonomuraea sp. LPB2021202275-12-8 TaxID=3120159 RepID=UPI00300D5020